MSAPSPRALRAVTTSTGGVNGTVSWSFSVDDSAIDYLGADDSLVQKYDVTVNDGNGGTKTQTITVTINGTNDAPTIELAPIVTEVPIPDPLPPGTDALAVHEVAPAMSEDGRWVVFFSAEQNPNDNNQGSPQGDVFLYDRLTGVTKVLTDDAHIPLASRPCGTRTFFRILDQR